MKRPILSAKESFSRRAFVTGSAGALASICCRGPFSESLLAQPEGPSKFVNPFIGASTNQKLGEGKTFPGPTTPFGMVQLGPDTITGGDNAPGYSYDHTTIEGFSFTHMSGVGWYGDFGNLQVMPTTGPMKLDSGRVSHPGEGWRSRFDHAEEVARANYYAVTLEEYGIRAEMTAAPRAGLLRFIFPPASTPRIQLNLARRIAGTSTRQYVKLIADNTVQGWMRCPAIGGGWGDGEGHVSYTIYFYMEFSSAPKQFGTWVVDVPEATFPVRSGLTTDYFETAAYRHLVTQGRVQPLCREMEGNHIGFFAEFPEQSTGENVMAKAGISFVSMEGAQRNPAHDIPDWDFEKVRDEGKALWDEALSSIDIDGASDTDRTIFTTALYHAMIDPRAIADADGRYTGPDGEIHNDSSYTRRTIFSGWDVFRGEFPLLTLVNPTVVNDEISSLIALAETSHRGYLERWEIMNAYSGCMDGDPATAIILDAHSKGIRGFDVEKAYHLCRQTAAGAGAATNRPDNDFYMAHGYVPNQVSWTLDNYYFDWCVSRLAGSLGKREDADLFSGRARRFGTIFDPRVMSMRARDERGNWIPWEGATEFGQGCSESNPGQQTWFVPHDVAGLIDLMGGNEAFANKLEEFFERTPASFGWNAYYNHANEPVHHIAHLFVYAGRPWLTQKWVRRILANAYHNQVDGLCGNDDVGQMSAWYVLGALGLYPVCPGDGIYILSSPLFRRATLNLDSKWYGGARFTITARNHSPDHIYVQSVRLNNKPLSRAWIFHSEVAAGGNLEFTMSAEPNREWGAGKEDVPPPSDRGLNRND